MVFMPPKHVAEIKVLILKINIEDIFCCGDGLTKLYYIFAKRLIPLYDLRFSRR
jgi:hypothetical protein